MTQRILIVICFTGIICNVGCTTKRWLCSSDPDTGETACFESMKQCVTASPGLVCEETKQVWCGEVENEALHIKKTRACFKSEQECVEGLRVECKLGT